VTDKSGRNPTPAPRTPKETCEKCGGPTTLAERLPKALGSPTYEIFRCRGCGAFEWVAQEDP